MRSDDRADDRPLIARIARRDAAALERLYALYRPRLWRYLWQQLDGDAGAVEDILQEVFLAVWLAAGDFRGEAEGNTRIFPLAPPPLAHPPRSAAPRPAGHPAEHAPFGEDEGRNDHTRGDAA